MDAQDQSGCPEVSIAICNLHAMAEGSRLTLLYVDNQQNHDLLGSLVPILSGVLWSVLTRIGCLDFFLHLVSRGRWKPNNCSKLLRESGAAEMLCCLALGEF